MQTSRLSGEACGLRRFPVSASEVFRSTELGYQNLSADVSWTSSQVWVEQVPDATRGVRFETFKVDAFAMVSARLGYRLFDDKVELGVVGTNLAWQHQRQHPFSQPVDTRVIGTVRLRL